MTRAQEEALRTLLLEVAKRHGHLETMYPMAVGVSDPAELLGMVILAMLDDGWPVKKAHQFIRRKLGISAEEVADALALVRLHSK